MEQTHPLITVFTPAYNRKPYLRPLYDSLKRQTYRSFEWIVVDDGSRDGTCDEVAGFIGDDEIFIQYHFQENAGKHVAINKGVGLAKGELFFIVDSDDRLTPHALACVAKHWDSISSRSNADRFAGVCGLRIHSNGEVIGGDVDYDVLDVSAIDYRFKLAYKGDRAEVIRTDIMKQYPYPSFSGERFCADALVWNRIGREYILRYFNEGIYICEYLPGGITDTSVRLRQRSPRGASLYYAEMAKLPGLSPVHRFKAAINFWRFARHDKQRGLQVKWTLLNSRWSIVAFPAGWLLSVWDWMKSTRAK